MEYTTKTISQHKHITIRVASMLHRSFALPIFPDETFQLEVMQRDEVVLWPGRATHAALQARRRVREEALSVQVGALIRLQYEGP